MSLLKKILTEYATEISKDFEEQIKYSAEQTVKKLNARMESLLEAIDVKNEVASADRILEIIEGGGIVRAKTLKMTQGGILVHISVDGRDIFYPEQIKLEEGLYKLYLFIEPIEDST